MLYSLSSKSYNLAYKNIMARNWYLKIAPLATAEGSLGKRHSYLKPCYFEKGQNNNNTNKPKTWTTPKEWRKRMVILENVILSLENVVVDDDKECTAYFLLKNVNEEMCFSSWILRFFARSADWFPQISSPIHSDLILLWCKHKWLSGLTHTFTRTYIVMEKSHTNFISVFYHQSWLIE